MAGGPGGLDAVAAAAAVTAGIVSADAVVADARARIARWEPWLGAVVAPLDPGAWKPGPLAGVVTGIKDLLAVAGAARGHGDATTAQGEPQAASATSVRRLAEAGAALVARLALHPWAYGITTPATRNPRNPDRVAGGSSGGSGAALAAGLVHASLGTDTGGSVRIPAACCGVVGLKTTRGLVPLTGVQPLAWSLDTVGPMAASVADAALLLSVIAGYDEADPVSVPAGVPPTAAPADPLRLRVGVPDQTRGARMDDAVRAVWLDTLDALVAAGARVEAVELPSLPAAHAANGRVLAAEAAAVHGELRAAAPERFPDDVRARIDLGLGLDAVAVARSRRVGAELSAEVRRAWGTVDVLLTPTLPCVVPPRDAERVEVGGGDETVVSAMTRFTNPWNLTGLPAGSVPAGTDAGGAPVGVQVVGPRLGDARVLGVMATVEALRGGPWVTVDEPPA